MPFIHFFREWDKTFKMCVELIISEELIHLASCIKSFCHGSYCAKSKTYYSDFDGKGGDLCIREYAIEAIVAVE